MNNQNASTIHVRPLTVGLTSVTGRTAQVSSAINYVSNKIGHLEEGGTAQMEDRIKASVIVDVASFAYRVGGPDNGHYIDIDVARLGRLIESYSFDVIEMAVAAPFMAVSLGTGEPLDHARRLSHRTVEWWSRQRKAWDGSNPPCGLPKVLPGATNGGREVGVDLMVAAGALDAVRRIEADKSGAIVIVCSHDSDLHHLYRYSHSVPVVVCGSFKHSEWRLLDGSRTPYLELLAGDLASVAMSARGTSFTSAVVQEELGSDRRNWPSARKWVKEELRPGDRLVVDRANGRALSPPLNRTSTFRRIPYRPLSRARTVAVVDPYGMFNAAVRSIGIGAMPTAESARDLVEFNGWDSPVAVYATIPDLDAEIDRNLAASLKKAWKRRDVELDCLAAEFDSDGDPLTQQQRARLKPRAGEQSVAGYERDVAARAIKRLATGMLADLWLGATVNPGVDLVLVSDDPDLAVVLDLLPAVGIDTYADVVRVGVHTARYRVEVDSRPRGTRGEHSSSFVVMTESQLATLVGVQARPHGGLLRHILHVALENRTGWRRRGTDPETGAFNVTTRVLLDTDGDAVAEEHEIEARLYPNGFRMNNQVMARLQNHGAQTCEFHITFDPQAPCAHPVLSALDAPPSPTAGARVMSQRGADIHVDTDADGLADVTVSFGHSSQSLRQGTIVRVGRGESSGKWYLVDPGEYVEEVREPELVTVVDYSGVWPRLQAVEDGLTGLGTPPPGGGSISAREGDVLVALRTGEGGQFCWLVLSSPLAHLAQMLTAGSETGSG